MKTEISFPELGLVAMTRAFLGAGIAFVVADRLDTRERKAIGWTLTAVGALTTIPLLFEILSHRTDQRRFEGEYVDDSEGGERIASAPGSGRYEPETIGEAELQEQP